MSLPEINDGKHRNSDLVSMGVDEYAHLTEKPEPTKKVIPETVSNKKYKSKK